MPIKLRQLTTSKSLTPGELELINRNFYEIELSLTALGSNNPSDPSVPPFTPPDLSEYFFLPGRSGGQLGYGGTAAADKLKLFGNSLAVAAGATFGGEIWLNSAIAIRQRGGGVALDAPAPDIIMNPGNPTATAGEFRFLHPNTTNNPVMLSLVPTGQYFELKVTRNSGGIGYLRLTTTATPHTDYGRVHIPVTGTTQPTLTFAITDSSQTSDCLRVLSDTLTVRSRVTFDGKIAIDQSIAGILSTDRAKIMLGTFSNVNGNFNGIALVSTAGSVQTHKPLAVYDGSLALLTYIDYLGRWNGPVIGAITPSGTTTFTSLAIFRDNNFLIQDDGDNSRQLAFQLSGISSGNTRTWTIPDFSDTLLGLTGTQSPTNKTFDNSNIFTVRDDRFTLQDSGGTTRQAQFQLSSITAGQTRILTIQDFDGTLALLDQAQNWTGIQTFNAAVNFVGAQTISGNTTFTTSLITVDTTSGAQLTLKTSNGGADVLGYYFDGAGNDYTLQIGGTYANATLIFPSAGGTVVTTTATQGLTAKSINGGSITSTGRTTGLGVTNFTLNPSSAAVYEIHIVLEITAAGGADRTVDVQVAWTDNVGAATQNLPAPWAANATGRTSMRVCFRRASGNISVQTIMAGAAGGAPTHNIYARALNVG